MDGNSSVAPAPAGEFNEFARPELEQTIHRRFERQVERFPDRLAVKTSRLSLDYRALNRAANRVAYAILSEPGARQSECVALLMEQSAELMSVILGCLKAGKIYVPLDPEFPRATLARMLTNAGPGLILAGGRHLGLARELLPAGACPVMDAAHAESGPWPEANPGVDMTPDAPAYVFYTSGSTGEPKGVVDSHRNVLHNIMRYTNGLKIGPNDRLTLLQQPSFSGAVSSMYGALLNGAAIYPISPRQESPASLAEWVRENELTMWHSVPTLFRLLCSAGGEFPSVRVIRLEGDRSAPCDVALFRQHFGAHCVLVNGLGATETGISRRYFMSRNTPLPAAGIVPIGYAVEDMDVTVIGENGRSVPEGQAGEIVVRSQYLALGYWKQPDLTAQAFHSDGATCVYRTGDLGRMLPGGCLEHLGRLDARVKLRGHWVDLADVEAALATARGVAQAAAKVTASSGGEEEGRLVGYFIPESGAAPPTVSMLRRHLTARLAPHQVPAAFVMLAEWPVTQNGKLDRRALPAAGINRPLLDNPFVPPGDEQELRVAMVWQRALELDSIGVEDNFFELGGDSLAAARVVSELEVDMAALLEAPTVRQLARRIKTGGSRSDQLVLPLRTARNSSQPPLFCIPGHDGVALGYHNLARNLPDGQPVIAFLPPAVTGEWQGRRSVPELAARYVEELLRRQPRGPRLLSGLCFGGLVAYEMACQLKSRGEAVESLILLECCNEAWIDRQPAVERWRAQAALTLRRAAFHLTHSARLGPRGGWMHARRRLAAVRNERDHVRMQRQFDQLTREGKPLPAELRQVALANRAASREWTPRPYDGRVVLLAGNEPRAGAYLQPQMGWAGLLTGPVECETVSDELRGLLTGPALAAVVKRVVAETARASARD